MTIDDGWRDVACVGLVLCRVYGCRRVRLGSVQKRRDRWPGSSGLPINSLGATCTPGYALAHGPHPKFNSGDLFPLTTAWALSRGHAVLVPDHEGPFMAYAEPTVAGHAVLDGIRAVRDLDPDMFGRSRFAVAGYSGGAIAAYGAAVLQPEYAPDLADAVAGVAMGGLISDYPAIARRFNGSVASGILMAARFAGVTAPTACP
ncbi:lipase family protein [Nocardia rhizosphaerae]|uniref:Lipase family protein n=1 Tax=Nocardia rhizosphaerae TaxID=1691571 RepID=A0ABV8L4B9_9NOCA